ncbi:MAG: hypothetical protein MJ244_02360 [Clostridia bacterium]|nr:hypothetical protein [Clostridia bacterium]
MKSPLRYQMTEFDSCQTAILNGITYLIDREKLNPSLISQIYRYSFDKGMGEVFEEDNYTSDGILPFISKYINEFNYNKDYKIHFDEIKPENISLEFINECITNNSTLIVPIYMDNKERYVTITDCVDNNLFIFDPYYIDESSNIINENKDIIFENNKPLNYNRIINKDRLFSDNIPYAINKNSNKAFVITKNNLKEGVKFSKKFDYIFDKTTI